MPATSAPRGGKARRASKPPAGSRAPRGTPFQAVWPLLICVAITPFAVHAASIVALEGPKQFALLYPWMEVVRSPVLDLSASTMSTLTQWLLYLQFPLYGVLMTVTFRADRYLRALIIGLMAHFGGLVTAVLLAYFAQ